MFFNIEKRDPIYKLAINELCCDRLLVTGKISGLLGKTGLRYSGFKFKRKKANTERYMIDNVFSVARTTFRQTSPDDFLEPARRFQNNTYMNKYCLSLLRYREFIQQWGSLSVIRGFLTMKEIKKERQRVQWLKII